MRYSNRNTYLPIIGVLAWGVLPFGAVHPWAYWPLLSACLIVSTWLSFRTLRWNWIAGATAILLVGPLLLQIIPLSENVLARIAPATVQFLEIVDVARATGQTIHSHPISIAPRQTALCAFFLTVGWFWVTSISGSLRDFVRPGELARYVVWLALPVALLGLVQKATFNGKIYWLWESRFRGDTNYFGPFVNRNHFAGWMLLALALGTGYFLGQLALASSRGARTWRERVLWLGSASAGSMASTGAALLAMATSIVWTLSRSGMAASACVLGLLGLIAIVRMPDKARRRSATAALLVSVIAVAGWKGIDTLATKYADTYTLQERFILWNDSLPALRDFYGVGSGINTYGSVMLAYPQTNRTVHAQQAHNDYLQLAIEGGLLVGIPVLLAVALLALKILQRLRQPQDEMTWWVRMGAVAGLGGMAIQELTEFSLQIPGVAVLFAVLIAIAIHEPAQLVTSRAKVRTRTRPNKVSNLTSWLNGS